MIEHFWSIPNNRRKFFDIIAQRLGFDPLIPENWYSFDKSEVNNEKVIYYILLLCYLLFLCRVFRQF